MSLDETYESLLRKVIREELQGMPLDDRLLTAEQAAERLGYTDTGSVRRLVREGRLEAVSLGNNTRRYRNSDVQRLVQEGFKWETGCQKP